MPAIRDVEVAPITDADVPTVAEFLANGMDSGVSAVDWRRAMSPSWPVEQPNHGYLLRADGRVVGAYLAFYSERVIDGRVHRVCDLGAWCVDAEYRSSGLRLLWSLLRQRDYTFTDLSPSGNVVPLNNRLGFSSLDTTTSLVPNLPWPVRSRGPRVVDAPDEMAAVLSGADLKVYRDHVSVTAAYHAVLVDGDRYSYVMFRRDRRKRLPLFATILYVGDTEVFRACAPVFYRYLWVHHRIPFTLAEVRVIGHRARRSITVAGRTRMYFGDDLRSDQIDYLYSELACIAW